MFNYLRGIVVEIAANYIVLDNKGIGFQIFVGNPYSFRVDEEYCVYLYNYVREDEYSLYGFKKKEEKDIFLRLINVKGLGPKMALPMVSGGDVSVLIDAINQENLAYLTKFPKVGDKVARQIILDLKGKLVSQRDLFGDANMDDLVNVLVSLGYKKNDIKGIMPKIDVTKSLENQVKEALRLLMK